MIAQYWNLPSRRMTNVLISKTCDILRTIFICSSNGLFHSPRRVLLKFVRFVRDVNRKFIVFGSTLSLRSSVKRKLIFQLFQSIRSVEILSNASFNHSIFYEKSSNWLFFREKMSLSLVSSISESNCDLFRLFQPFSPIERFFSPFFSHSFWWKLNKNVIAFQKAQLVEDDSNFPPTSNSRLEGFWDSHFAR